MIKLSNIRYETKTESGFVLLGGKRTTSTLEAVNHLDDVNRLIHRLEAAIAERKARGIVVKTKICVAQNYCAGENCAI